MGSSVQESQGAFFFCEVILIRLRLGSIKWTVIYLPLFLCQTLKLRKNDTEPAFFLNSNVCKHHLVYYLKWMLFLCYVLYSQLKYVKMLEKRSYTNKSRN